mmetsp:Transcript_3499/g.13567  ORF Transcript_3499/g.13567 Transcript_3499/m.13567 type:complete len:409 (-) Transcript_3499:272-1498(-)
MPLLLLRSHTINRRHAAEEFLDGRRDGAGPGAAQRVVGRGGLLGLEDAAGSLVLVQRAGLRVDDVALVHRTQIEVAARFGGFVGERSLDGRRSHRIGQRLPQRRRHAEARRRVRSRRRRGEPARRRVIVRRELELGAPRGGERHRVGVVGVVRQFGRPREEPPRSPHVRRRRGREKSAPPRDGPLAMRPRIHESAQHAGVPDDVRGRDAAERASVERAARVVERAQLAPRLARERSRPRRLELAQRVPQPDEADRRAGAAGRRRRQHHHRHRVLLGPPSRMVEIVVVNHPVRRWWWPELSFESLDGGDEDAARLSDVPPELARPLHAELDVSRVARARLVVHSKGRRPVARRLRLEARPTTPPRHVRHEQHVRRRQRHTTSDASLLYFFFFFFEDCAPPRQVLGTHGA